MSEVIQFDGRKFALDLERAAKDLGTSLHKVCKEAGMCRSSISELKRGDPRRNGLSGRHLAFLLAWSGLRADDYVIDNREHDMTNRPCPVCGKQDPHIHGSEELIEWHDDRTLGIRRAA